MPWTSAAEIPALVAPDALDTSTVAVANLAVNAETMWAQQEFGRFEGLRLAQALDNVAAAYAEVDRAAGVDLESMIRGSGTRVSTDGTRFPDAVALPAPHSPAALPIPNGSLVSEQLLYPPDAQRALEAGDGGATLTAAAAQWRSNGQSLVGAASLFETKTLNWEGAAADAAYSKFVAYQVWLINLAEAWHRLAGEADRIVEAHSNARRDNDPIAAEFAALQRSIAQEPASADNLRRTVQMAALQAESEEVRHRYARDGQPRQIDPPDPPTPLMTVIPVTVDDDRRAVPHEPAEAREQGAVGAGDRDLVVNSGPQDSGTRAQSAPPAQQLSGGVPPNDTPGGGPVPAGQPGGTAGGGPPGAGAPIGPSRYPSAAPNPDVRPAALGGRAAGSGGGSAGAAPSPPAQSLQPSVRAGTVAPGPVAAPPPAQAQAGPAGGSAGMGGLAPMMHGARGEANGAKKRDPRLSPDTGIYTEDRPWTEAVVGNRVRRRTASDKPAQDSP